MSSLVKQAELVNPQNAHFSNPGFSSKVGAVVGCGGSTSSDLALQQKGMYQVVKTGGKKNSKSKRKMYKGGNGYGFTKDQMLAKTSGVNSVNGSVHLGEFSKYQNEGVKSDTNMDASKQSGGRNLSYGTGGYPYYSYNPVEGENLSVFAGSGYPPITTGLNSQCGGKKKTLRKKSTSKKSVNKKKTMRKKSHKKVSKKSSKKTRKTRKKQKGGYHQYLSNIANSHIYSTGAPPNLDSNQSALANPPPYTPKNNCLNTWKHLGDNAPYNEVYM